MGFPDDPQDNNKATDSGGRRYVYNEEENTWVGFGIVPVYGLVDRTKNGLIYPELFNKLKEIESKRNILNNIRLTDKKPYFYLFYSLDKLFKFFISNEKLHIEIDKGAIFRKLVSFPCAGLKGPKGITGRTGMTGKPPPIEKIRQTNNEGFFDLDVPTPLDDQPISLRGYNSRGERQLWEILINLDGSYDDPGGNTISLTFKDNVLSGQLTDPTNKFKVRQRGAKGLNGENGKNYVVARTTSATTGSEFIQVIESLWFNQTTNEFVYKQTSLSELLNNVLSVSAQSGAELPSGEYWSALAISTDALKSVEYHQFVFGEEPEAMALDFPSWTPLSGCYDQKRYTLGYLNYDTRPFDIIKDKFPEYSGCKEPFWFCGNSGNQPCDGEINVNPAENTILFIESTSSVSSGSSASSESSSSSDTSTSSESFSSGTSISTSSVSSETSLSSGTSSSTGSSDSSESSESYSTNSSESSRTSESSSYSSYSSESESTGSTSFIESSESSASPASDSSGTGTTSRQSISSESDQSRQTLSSLSYSSTSSPFDESSESSGSPASDSSGSDTDRESLSSESEESRQTKSSDTSGRIWSPTDNFIIEIRNTVTGAIQPRAVHFLDTVAHSDNGPCPNVGTWAAYIPLVGNNANWTKWRMDIGPMIHVGGFGFGTALTLDLYAEKTTFGPFSILCTGLGFGATWGEPDVSGAVTKTLNGWSGSCSVGALVLFATITLTPGGDLSIITYP